MEIFEKTEALQKLVKEKEWLVREIHHRVKNNLQFVMSLLDAQADYLENETALKAIQESRQRMQAISLIHQKLYQVGSPEIVEMQIYIRELISYIRAGYTGIGGIYFDVRIDDIKLRFWQAVPIGLILNESITNAIKYAYPNTNIGSISVSLSTDSDSLLLSISDNGVGLPDEVYFTKINSLGFELIETFCNQLEAKMTIIRKGGLTLHFRFKQSGTNFQED